jgi:hypothetical protein
MPIPDPHAPALGASGPRRYGCAWGGRPCPPVPGRLENRLAANRHGFAVDEPLKLRKVELTHEISFLALLAGALFRTPIASSTTPGASPAPFNRSRTTPPFADCRYAHHEKLGVAGDARSRDQPLDAPHALLDFVDLACDAPNPAMLLHHQRPGNGERCFQVHVTRRDAPPPTRPECRADTPQGVEPSSGRGRPSLPRPLDPGISRGRTAAEGGPFGGAPLYGYGQTQDSL